MNADGGKLTSWAWASTPIMAAVMALLSAGQPPQPAPSGGRSRLPYPSSCHFAAAQSPPRPRPWREDGMQTEAACLGRGALAERVDERLGRVDVLLHRHLTGPGGDAASWWQAAWRPDTPRGAV